jgi:hypothetical protein
MTPRIPLFIVCPECERVREVRNRYTQRRYRDSLCKSCSGRRSLAKTDHRASGTLGGKACQAKFRAARLAALKGLAPLEAYRLGRMHGWAAGARSVRRRLKLSTQRAA